MTKVFLTRDALYYRAKEKKNDDDAHILFPSKDTLEHLDETPVTVSELNERIRLTGAGQEGRPSAHKKKV